MVKALVFGTRDCAFESHRGRSIIIFFVCLPVEHNLSICVKSS